MATATLPPSSTMCPSASRRASRPATRTAEGPISTPRRDWPRSRGTPMTRIFLGVMLEKDGAVLVIKSSPQPLKNKIADYEFTNDRTGGQSGIEVKILSGCGG